MEGQTELEAEVPTTSHWRCLAPAVKGSQNRRPARGRGSPEPDGAERAQTPGRPPLHSRLSEQSPTTQRTLQAHLRLATIGRRSAQCCPSFSDGRGQGGRTATQLSFLGAAIRPVHEGLPFQNLS